MLSFWHPFISYLQTCKHCLIIELCSYVVTFNFVSSVMAILNKVCVRMQESVWLPYVLENHRYDNPLSFLLLPIWIPQWCFDTISSPIANIYSSVLSHNVSSIYQTQHSSHKSKEQRLFLCLCEIRTSSSAKQNKTKQKENYCVAMTVSSSIRLTFCRDTKFLLSRKKNPTIAHKLVLFRLLLLSFCCYKVTNTGTWEGEVNIFMLWEPCSPE
jgi:hypothetical protein